LRIAEVTTFYLFVPVPFIAGLRLPFDFRRSIEIELEDSKMKKKLGNNGQSFEDILQNRFTSYVEKALTRNRDRYWAKLKAQRENEITMDIEGEDSVNLIAAEDITESGDRFEFNPDNIDDIRLFEASKLISREDMMIIKLHVLYGLTYVSIANSMGVSWSVVASRYNRAIKKIRNYMEAHR